MKICPLCEHGLISKIKVKSTNEIIYICNECEALWNNINICEDEVLNFDSFMKSRKLQLLWDEFNVVEIL
ncbi:hypothetical protein [Anaerosporobacter sp.]|uniref:hypothetical protein n=1 Tax=Anaerosporobacter sp. TaxID=1872529 RepID=UPI00286F5073|nr:hypothetical protein [Anaerosporobacter sp.]